MDRLDRYHGFGKLTPAHVGGLRNHPPQVDGQDQRRRGAPAALPRGTRHDGARAEKRARRERRAGRAPDCGRSDVAKFDDLLKLNPAERARALAALDPEGRRANSFTTGPSGPLGPEAAAGRLDLLAHPGRPRRRQDARRRRSGARMGQELRHRQPDRRHPRRRARHHGAGRIRPAGDLPRERAARVTPALRSG